MGVIKVINVTKSFGDFKAVRNLNLEVKQGEILGFLGSNGAGKTTTIKMLTGQLLPTSGTIEILGMDILTRSSQIMKQVGYVPDTPIIYEGLSPKEMLYFLGKLYKLDSSTLARRTDELLELLNLKEFENELIKSFSLGMKKKVSIASGIIHSPKLLILDEVTNGLDPRTSREVKDLIKHLNRMENVTCLITTHILDIVEELAHGIAIINKGELKAIGDLSTLQESYQLPSGNLEEIFLKATS